MAPFLRGKNIKNDFRNEVVDFLFPVAEDLITFYGRPPKARSLDYWAYVNGVQAGLWAVYFAALVGFVGMFHLMGRGTGNG